MKGVIHYIWKNRLLPKGKLFTTDGECIYIIDCGTESDEEENTFCNARIKIGDNEWSGNVVLHYKSSDWEKQLHRGTQNYSNVILHVTMENDCEALRHHGEAIKQLCIECPQGLEREFADARHHSKCLPCATALAQVETVKLHGYLSRLLAERIEEKATIIRRTFAECNGLWDDTLLKTIIRSFGFGIQSTIFEEWARTLDTNALGKHRDNPMQVEAIICGQAGLLDGKSIPYCYRNNALNSEYYKGLVREYKFLKHKFNLKSIDYKHWGNGSITPHVRIARIASLFCRGKLDFSAITACNTATDYYRLLDNAPGGYWSNHTCFGGTETYGNGSMKQRQLDIIIINAIIPILYIYGKNRNESALCNKAEDLLHQLKCEENSIIKKWKEKGVAIECAADSQAILQLEHRYCRLNNCVGCRFAYHYIKEKIAHC